MLIGYVRVSKADGSQLLDMQLDALIGAGVAADRIYEETAGVQQKGPPARPRGLPEGAAARQHLDHLEAGPTQAGSPAPGSDGG